MSVKVTDKRGQAPVLTPEQIEEEQAILAEAMEQAQAEVDEAADEVASESDLRERLELRMREAVNNPIDSFIAKMFDYMVSLPEYYIILNLPRHERKALEKHLAKQMTRFPHFRKTDFTQEQMDATSEA